MKEKLAIIASFGLQVEEIEPCVYKVLNTDKEVNIDKLLMSLKKATIFYSENYRDIFEHNYVSTIASVECIILDFKNPELNSKYCTIFNNAYLRDYKEGKVIEDNLGLLIDTRRELYV